MRSRGLLLAFETALASILLCGSGLLVGTYLNLREQDLGFYPDDLAMMRVGASRKYPGMARIQFFDEFQDRLRRLPGVQSVSMIQDPPLTYYGWWTPSVHTEDPVRDIPPKILNHTVTADYMRTAGIPVLRGRGITAADASGPLVAVLSETAARKLWPDDDPIGKSLRFNEDPEPLTVVGIVGDVRQEALDFPVMGEMYTPYSAFPYWPSMYVMVRTTPGANLPVASMRSQLAEMDANIPFPEVIVATEQVSNALAASRFNASLIAAFACVAVLLSMAGIHGTLQYLVNAQRRDMGVRVALGASSREILFDVLRRGLLPTGIGIVLGLATSAGLSSVMASLLYGVPTVDLPTFATAATVIVVAATAACVIPARRASRVDPVESLRAP